jgi:serine/threonine protein kinase
MYEYFLNGNNVFVVTELLDQDLYVWRRECQVFTEGMAIDICRSILQSLKFISENNVVHRDIKLQNILFRSRGDFKSLKLVDFGLSCILGANEYRKDFCGSIGYIAPEVYAGTRYRFEVDMFSFGVLLFRLLSSERPFSNDSHALRRHTLNYQYNVDGNAWKNVSNVAKDLVRKLLVNRDKRLTANEALAHPWFLSQAQHDLEKTNALVDSVALLQRKDKHSEYRCVCKDPPGKISENSTMQPSYFKSEELRHPTWINSLRIKSNCSRKVGNDSHTFLTSARSLFRSRIAIQFEKFSVDSVATSAPTSLDRSGSEKDSHTDSMRSTSLATPCPMPSNETPSSCHFIKCNDQSALHLTSRLIPSRETHISQIGRNQDCSVLQLSVSCGTSYTAPSRKQQSFKNYQYEFYALDQRSKGDNFVRVLLKRIKNTFQKGKPLGHNVEFQNACDNNAEGSFDLSQKRRFTDIAQN